MFRISRCCCRRVWKRYKQQVRELLTSDEGIEKRKQRWQVEAVFGNIKQNKGFRRFNLRGIEKEYRDRTHRHSPQPQTAEHYRTLISYLIQNQQKRSCPRNHFLDSLFFFRFRYQKGFVHLSEASIRHPCYNPLSIRINALSIVTVSLEVKEKKKRLYYYLAFVLFTAVVAGVIFTFLPGETTSALDAPLSKGYETALVDKSIRPIFRPKGTAPAVWGPGDLYRMLITGEESNNALFQFEAVVPKGGGPPPHRHSKEDETFYVVSGELGMLIGDKMYTAKAGDFVYIPRDTVHQFKNTGSGPAVQFVTFVGAGMEGFFKEVFPEAKDQNAAPPPVTEELIRRMNEAGPKYGIKFLPPPNVKKP